MEQNQLKNHSRKLLSIEGLRILDKIRELPAIPLTRIPLDNEVWEAEENGAFLIMTKRITGVNITNFAAVTISGLVLSRQRLILDFETALGTPDSSEISTTNDTIDTLGWLLVN